MTVEERYRRLDEATVILLTETSHSGVGRDFLVSCSWCWRPMWAGRWGLKRYCSPLCKHRSHYQAGYERILAANLARDRARRTTRVGTAGARRDEVGA